MTSSLASKPKCPVCSSERVTTLYTLSSEDAAQHFIRREGNPQRHQDLAAHIETLWGDKQSSVQQCLDCEFGFAYPYVAGDMLFYKLAYEHDAYPRDKWEYNRTVEELAGLNFHGQRVLELGAGHGFFLDKIVDVHVPKAGIRALEFDEGAVATLQRKGYAAIQQDVHSAPLEPGSDAAFLFQVLEHMDQLDALFDRLHSLLRKDGLLIIAVPNAIEIGFNEQNGSLLDTPPNHIGRWSERAFKTMGERHGFRLDRFEVEPFSLKNFVLQDIVYSYQRTSQEAGTLANWSRKFRRTRYGKLLGAAVAAAYAPRRLNVWRRAASTPNMGGCVWAKFVKTAA